MFEIFNFLETYPYAYSGILLLILLLSAWLSYVLTKRVVLSLLQQLFKKVSNLKNQETIQTPIASRLATVVPLGIISVFISQIPLLPTIVISLTQDVANSLIVLALAIAFSHVLDYVNILYMRRNSTRTTSIKGFIQIGKITGYLVALILIASFLIDKNPLILLSGLGAMAAVLMLIFQDTILSLVASIQINSSGVVRVGDWIEMPQVNADGDVIDIALYTVTVQNFDKTYTIFPTKRLVSDAFKNWRGMKEAGGRRIKRSLWIDQNSVHFLSKSEIENLQQFDVLADYLSNKKAELDEWNREKTFANNQRRLTNLGTFRAYVEHYLLKHPQVHQGFSLMVRQLQPGEFGIPLEIYCFTTTTIWADYEAIQSDIFDHLLAILPEFGLRIFQQPSGSDFRALQGFGQTQQF